MTDVPLFRSRRHTVLVIEDDSANRQLLASMLTRERYTVRTAADGESGLIAALDPDLDLILLDIGLPVIDGLVIRTGAGRQFDPGLSPMFLEILDGTIVRPN